MGGVDARNGICCTWTSAPDSASGQVARTCEQETMVAAFRHGTSRNLDPVLYTHSEIANTVQDTDANWGTIQTIASRPQGCCSALAGSKASTQRTELTGPDKSLLGYTLEFDLAQEGPGPFLRLGRTTVGPAQLTPWNTTDPVRSLPRPSNRFRAA